MKPPVASSKPGRGSTSRQQPQARRPVGRRAKGEHWSLRLYVAGQTPRSLAAFANLKQLCETHLQGRYDLEVIDLMRSPELARQDEIVALPTVVRRLPEPIKRVIGNLSSMERVMVGIDLAPPKSRR